MPDLKRCAPFSLFLYRRRNLDECFLTKLKHLRAIVTRFEKSLETT